MRAAGGAAGHSPLPGYVLINGLAEEVPDPGDELSTKMHRRYPKPGIEDQAEHDRIWLSEGRVVFRLPTENAFGMDQRKAATSLYTLAMGGPSAAVERGVKTGHSSVRTAPRAATRRSTCQRIRSNLGII